MSAGQRSVRSHHFVGCTQPNFALSMHFQSLLSHDASQVRRSSSSVQNSSSVVEEPQRTSRKRLTMSLVAPSAVRELYRCHGALSGGACGGIARFTRAQGKLSCHRKALKLMHRTTDKGTSLTVCSSSHDMASNENDFDLSRYHLTEIVAVRPEAARYRNENKTKVEIPNWMILLKIQDTNNVVAVYVGHLEATSLTPDPILKPRARPMTHDLMKNTLTALGARVTKVCITALVDATFHARVHCARSGTTEEIVLDARPSDALNLAVRYTAPIYMHKAVADKMASPISNYESRQEAPSEIEQMCRDALRKYHDPTVVFKMNMQIAIEEDRFEDAAKIRNDIEHLLSGNRTFSLVVAMESALADKRWEECAHLCKELNKLIEGGAEGRV